MATFPIEPTRALHQRLLQVSRDAPADMAEVFGRVNEEIARQGVAFERQQAMTVAPSALVLSTEGESILRHLGETLFAIVEKAIDTLVANPDVLGRFFPEHQRIMPYLRHSQGLDSWQGYSRYDVVITPEGRLQVIELNTCCPAGFSHAETIATSVRKALVSLGVLQNGSETGPDKSVIGAIPFDALFDELLAIEKASELQPACIALVNDENRLVNEFDLMARALEDRGREVLIASASDLTFDPTEKILSLDKRPISLVYNKIRVSTPESPNHCWGSGFEDRYADFLAAVSCGAVASVNGPAAWTIAEDKTLLQWLTNAEFTETLPKDQQQFVHDHIATTARLDNEPATWNGETIDPIEYALKNRNELVLKPANEGRGYGVSIGSLTPVDQWEKDCRSKESYPRIIQQYAPMAQFPVVDPARVAEPGSMYWTIGLFVMRGKYRGALSRISPNPVNNVGRQGFVQAIVAGED